MRILHTSDWHLGRSLGSHRLLDDQAAVADWVVEVVAAEDVGLVVVAGDLFDRSVPPAEAVTLLADTFRRIRAAGALVVAIAGNHDSAERIQAHAGLTDAAGVHLRGGYGAAAEVLGLTVGGRPLDVVAVPYLDPVLAPPAAPTEVARPTHETVLRDAVVAAGARRRAGVPALAVAHAFVAGARPSDSERDLAVGEAGMVSADVVGGFDYVALGHLHRPQIVAGSSTIRYSGSPLPYSFSERGEKEVVLVDLAGPGAVVVRPLAVPVGRPVRIVRGRFDEIVMGDGDERAYVRVEYTDPAPVADAHRRLRDRFPHLVEVARVGSPSARPVVGADVERLRARTPLELATEFWTDVVGDEPDERVTGVLAAGVERLVREPVS